MPAYVTESYVTTEVFHLYEFTISSQLWGSFGFRLISLQNSVWHALQSGRLCLLMTYTVKFRFILNL